jgi:Xaa-Pro aminopeptidase
MAVTVEPGFYRVDRLRAEMLAPGTKLGAAVCASELRKYDDVRGIRIEDDVLVTPGGPEVLTLGAPKAVEDVESNRAPGLRTVSTLPGSAPGRL